MDYKVGSVHDFEATELLDLSACLFLEEFEFLPRCSSPLPSFAPDSILSFLS